MPLSNISPTCWEFTHVYELLSSFLLFYVVFACLLYAAIINVRLIVPVHFRHYCSCGISDDVVNCTRLKHLLLS